AHCRGELILLVHLEQVEVPRIVKVRFSDQVGRPAFSLRLRKQIKDHVSHRRIANKVVKVLVQAEEKHLLKRLLLKGRGQRFPDLLKLDAWHHDLGPPYLECFLPVDPLPPDRSVRYSAIEE